jgi:hypothetical protein
LWDSRKPENVTTEVEDTVGIRQQLTTGEDTANGEDLIRAEVNCRECELAIAL